MTDERFTVRQLTHAPHGHLLTNVNVWAPDSQRLVYDVRSDAAGATFDGTRIESVALDGTVRVLYEATNGAHCGVATYSPAANRIAFIIGPEPPTPDFTYGPARRLGLIVEETAPGVGVPLDARNLVAPFTLGALRGGSHVHIFAADGERISFTYEDHVLTLNKGEANLRTIGVTQLGHAVTVPNTHPRNRSGNFSVLAVRVTDNPKPGSDEINKAVEESWIGTRGYVRIDGTRQRHALAFQGQVLTATGAAISEVFVCDLPDDLTQPSDGPLEGTPTTRPRPPRGTMQRRLTFTANRPHPGLTAPRHWLRSSPDGSRIAFLMRDDAGLVQLWTISPNGGAPTQVTHHAHDIASAFTWSPDGTHIAHVLDQQVCVTNVTTGESRPLTPRYDVAPQPEACVYSPDGQHVAFVRRVVSDQGEFNQVFIAVVGK